MEVSSAQLFTPIPNISLNNLVANREDNCLLRNEN